MKNQNQHIVIPKNTTNHLAPGGAKHTMPLVLSPLWGKYREAGKGGCKQVLPLWRGWHVVPGEGVIRKCHPQFCRPQDPGIFHARRYQTKCHSRVSLSGISTLFSNHGFTARSVTPQKTYRLGVSPTGAASKLWNTCHKAGNLSGLHPTYKGCRAFTLIELLVVVLIIGILAAVAVPQYQKAVEKSRAVEVISLLNAAEKAINVFMLENGYQDASTEDFVLTIKPSAQFKQNFGYDVVCWEEDQECRVMLNHYSDARTQADIDFDNRNNTWTRTCTPHNANGEVLCNYLKQSYPDITIN